MKTSTADICLSPQGIILLRVEKDAKQGLPEAKENLAAAIEACGGRKRPLMTDIRECHPLTPEARRYYSGQVLIDWFSAVSLLIDASPFGRMMGNIYLQIARPGVPTKLFMDEREALAWLGGFIGE